MAIFITMKDVVKGKMNQHAKHFRLMSRMEAFQQKRKTYDQLDYLRFYPPELKSLILDSMQGPLPQQLPPLNPTTISLYRRQSRPVFMTRNPNNQDLDGHLTYESLWILSSLDEKLFQDYSSIVKQFERDLPLYLSAQSPDIREMAIVTAGNKIIGKEQDILRIVQQDRRQMWVLVNHIQQHKIPSSKLFTFLPQHNEFAFKSVFELTMLALAIGQEILQEEKIVQCIVGATTNPNENIRKYAIRILGNLVASNDETLRIINKYSLLDSLHANLSCSNGQVRKDTCWLVSNLCTKKISATQVIQHTPLITKLVQLLAYETLPHLKRQLTYVFCYVCHYADRREALNLLGHPNVIEICYGQLCGEEGELEVITLRLLRELIELGDNFRLSEGRNRILEMMRGATGLWSQIEKKSYSQNAEVSSISLEIIGELQQDD